MAISNASRLADFGSGIGTDGAVLEVDNDNKRIGLGTTNPNTTVQVGAVGASGTSLFVHGDSRILGVITATKFSGGWDGSLSVTDTTASTSTSTGALVISGGVGIAKSLFVGEGVSIAGTITYDDVTNIDSVGIVTAGKGLRVTTGGAVITAGNVKVTAGIASVGAGLTLSSDFIHLTDNAKINCGVASDLVIYHEGGGDSIIHHTATSGSGLRFRARTFTFKNQANSATIATMNEGSACSFYDNGAKKIETTSSGAIVTGVLTATSFEGNGANLTGVVSGIEVKSAGTSVGTSLTAINFSGATASTGSAGITTITIAAAGLSTDAYSVPTAGLTTYLKLDDAQDHKLTASGITTVTCYGGTESESHTLRIVNSGITTVGFSTYFLWPSGGSPVLPTASGAISLISFTVQRVGAAGTQLLAGASLNFS